MLPQEVLDQVRNIVQTRLPGSEFLRLRQSDETDDIAIYFSVPIELYRDFDLLTSVGVEVLDLSDRLGGNFFAYFLPDEESGSVD